MSDKSIGLNKRKNVVSRISGIIIIFCAVLLGIETYFQNDTEALRYFKIADMIIVGYFTFEIIYRFVFLNSSIKEVPGALKRKMLNYKDINEQNINDGEIIEEWFWFLFDFILVVLGYLSFMQHLFAHPEAILVLRMFRIFRILRVFELNASLKSIERKIFSVIPTVLTFFLLITLIIYVYAIIGTFLYDFKKFDTIDFSNLHASIVGIFSMMSNGWGDVLNELKNEAINVSPLVSEIYILSFFVFSVLITLNVFLAVMTSQIQDKIKNELEAISKKEDTIIDQEKASAMQQSELYAKMEEVLKALDELKKQEKNK